jgi:hypothetical protein
MNNLPRETLRQILNKYGSEIGGNPKRCESLLNDLCGSYRREINVLVNAIEERVPFDLLAGAGSMPLEVLLTRLEKRLEEQTAMTGEGARWAVESWALALNVATDGEIKAREKRLKASPPFSNADTRPPEIFADNRKAPNTNLPKPTLSPKTPAAVPQPPINLPRRQPKNSPTVFPANNQNFNLPVQMPTTKQTAATEKGFGLFRGCLLVIILLIVSTIVLFLGVPYAIETMRETQRERNSEPPRFPVR